MNNGNTITSREDFFAQPTKTFPVELPDMGRTVHIIKGTWKTLEGIKNLDAQQLPEQIALLLATPDGQRICTSPEDVDKLREIVTLADMKLIIEKWQAANGLTKESNDLIEKNSAASHGVDSVSDSPVH